MHSPQWRSLNLIAKLPIIYWLQPRKSGQLDYKALLFIDHKSTVQLRVKTYRIIRSFINSHPYDDTHFFVII